MVVSERFDTLGLADPGRTYRLGIFGGTFDPIHQGHLAAGEFAREQLELDAVVFMPAGVPVFKKDQHVTSSAQRFAMCQLAVRDNPYFDVSPLEIQREGDTFTATSLRIMRDHFPKNVSLYFITGADAIMSVRQWKDACDLGGLATFVGMTRPGYQLTKHVIDELRDSIGMHAMFLEVPGLSISSSYLRKQCSEGKSIRYLTADAVRDYIEGQGLYKE